MKAKIEHKRGEFLSAFMASEAPIAQGATAAVKEAAEAIKSGARGSIAAAGFGKKWQNALRVDVYPKSGPSINAAAHIYHKIPYAWVFEEGAKIAGSPRLWLTSTGVPQKIGRNRMTPKNYPGPLQYVSRPGKAPMLMAQVRVSKAAAKKKAPPKLSAAAIRRGTAGSGVLRSVPVFVGVSSVKLRKRFDVSGAVSRTAGQLGALYMKHLEGE